MPADFEARDHEPPLWHSPQSFDRTGAYDASWLRYDEVDIFGDPLQAAAKL